MGAAQREIWEETGLHKLKSLKIDENEMVPIDIDTHIITYNERLKLPEHTHYEFRYLFMIDKISPIKVDREELSTHKWIDIDTLRKEPNYGQIALKIQKTFKKYFNE